MPKRILLAESGKGTRQAIESILRKSSFEVISVSTGDKACEVIQFTQPDLIIADAALNTRDQKPLHEKLSADPKSREIPLLIIDSAKGSELPYPDEVIIKRPVDPQEFMERVRALLSQQDSRSEDKRNSNPLSEQSVDDDFLDAALGLDQIHVTGSAVMDNTNIFGKKASRQADKLIGYDDLAREDTDNTAGPRVESLLINENSDISHKKKSRRKKQANETGSLEILSDPLADIQNKQTSNSGGVHDYNWFVNSIKDEVQNPGSAQVSHSESDGLHINDNSFNVDPVTPPPSGSKSSETGNTSRSMNEFKKEMEQLLPDESNLEAIESQTVKIAEQEKPLGWQDKIEDLTPEHLRIFAREFTEQLADRLARRICQKIDADKLHKLLKAELIAQAKKKS